MLIRLYKRGYEKKKALFEQKMKENQTGWKYAFPDMLSFGWGSLTILIFLASFFILFLPFIAAGNGIVEFPIQIFGNWFEFTHIFVIIYTIFVISLFLNTLLAIKYLDKHFFAELGYDISLNTFGVAIFIMAIMLLVVYGVGWENL